MKRNHLADAQARKRERDEKVRTVSSLKEALGRIEELEAHVSAIKALKQAKGIHEIKPRLGQNKSEATAFAIATDWHLGCLIRPEQVNHLNRFDVAIAKKRIERLFQSIVTLTDKERQYISISELVLFLGGDLIDGALHLDTVMSNEVAEPITQAVICQGLIEAGLDYLLNHGRFKKITVVCCDGN